MIDDLRFASLDIKVVVPLKLEREFKSGVGWCVRGHKVPPCKE